MHPQYLGELWPKKRENVTTATLPLSSLISSPWKNHPELHFDDANNSKVFFKSFRKVQWIFVLNDFFQTLIARAWAALGESWAETLGDISGMFGNPREGTRDEWIVPRPRHGHRVPHLDMVHEDTWAWRRNLGFALNSALRLFLLSYFCFLFLFTFCLAKSRFNHPKLHLCNTAGSLSPRRAQSKAQPAQWSPSLPNLTVPDKSELRFSSSSCLCEFLNVFGSSGAVPGRWEKQMLFQYLKEPDVMTLVITGLSDWYWAWNGCWRTWLIKD